MPENAVGEARETEADRSEGTVARGGQRAVSLGTYSYRLGTYGYRLGTYGCSLGACGCSLERMGHWQ